MKQKHDARAYFGKKFIVFDFLRNSAPNGYEIQHGNHYENKNWDKIMNVCPLVKF